MHLLLYIDKERIVFVCFCLVSCFFFPLKNILQLHLLLLIPCHFNNPVQTCMETDITYLAPRVLVTHLPTSIHRIAYLQKVASLSTHLCTLNAYLSDIYVTLETCNNSNTKKNVFTKKNYHLKVNA